MDYSIDTSFIEKLSCADPTPGGGGASAYCGALASACATFVGNLTYNNDKFSEIEQQVASSIMRLNDITSDLIFLIDEDARSFLPVAKALKMPKGEIRDRKIDETLVLACETPLTIMQKCLDILDECVFLATSGTRLAISDIGCASQIARASLISASLNVYANTNLFRNRDSAQHYKDLADELVKEGIEYADKVYEIVADEVGAWKIF